MQPAAPGRFPGPRCQRVGADELELLFEVDGLLELEFGEFPEVGLLELDCPFELLWCLPDFL